MLNTASGIGPAEIGVMADYWRFKQVVSKRGLDDVKSLGDAYTRGADATTGCMVANASAPEVTCALLSAVWA